MTVSSTEIRENEVVSYCWLCLICCLLMMQLYNNLEKELKATGEEMKTFLRHCNWAKQSLQQDRPRNTTFHYCNSKQQSRITLQRPKEQSTETPRNSSKTKPRLPSSSLLHRRPDQECMNEPLRKEGSQQKAVTSTFHAQDTG